MKMNGMSCDIKFTKKTDGYIHFAERTISSDIPNQYNHDDTTSNYFNWFLALVPGYKYTINIQGLFIVKKYEGNNPNVLSSGIKDDATTVSFNGYRDTWSHGDNYVHVNSSWKLTNVRFHNSNTVIDLPWTNVRDTPYTNDAGVTFTIENVTDEPYCIVIQHYGIPFVLSEYTNTAIYYRHCQCLVEHIETSDGNLVMDRYAGYHDKTQMMHYLNAYWTTYDLYLNSLMWNDDTLTPFYWKDIYEV